MTSQSPSRLRRGLRVVATVALLGATLAWVDVGAVADVWKEADVVPLLIGVGLSVPLMIVLATRWTFTASRMGLELPFGVALREYYASTLLNRVLPGGFVGDVGRALRGGRRNPNAKGAAARSVVLERVSGQLALWGVLSVGFISLDTEEGLLVPASVLGGLCVIGAMMTLIVRNPSVANSRVGRTWSTIVGELRASFVNRGAWAVQLGLSLMSVLLLVATYAACAEAVGAGARWQHLLFIAPVLLAVTSLPVSVGGWGVREAVSVPLYSMAGLDPVVGVAASAAYGATALVSVLPGLFVLLLRADGRAPRTGVECAPTPKERGRRKS